MTANITIEQWPNWIRGYFALDDKSNFSRVLDRWHNGLQATVMHSFQTQASPRGVMWDDWHWRTWEYKKSNEPTLQNSRNLYNSFMRGGARNVDDIGPKESTFGSKSFKALIHNQGGTYLLGVDLYHRGGRGKKKSRSTITVPPRTMLEVTDAMATILAEMVADFLVEEIGRMP